MDLTASGFGALVADGMPEFRALAESLFTITFTVYEPSGQTKDNDGYTVQGYTTKTPTPGKVQSGSTQGRDTTTRYVKIGDADRPVLEGGLHIPVSSEVPVAGEQRGIGWEYEVTAVGDQDDPALLGRRYLVVGVPAKSFPTARRLDVVEV